MTSGPKPKEESLVTKEASAIPFRHWAGRRRVGQLQSRNAGALRASSQIRVFETILVVMSTRFCCR